MEMVKNLQVMMRNTRNQTYALSLFLLVYALAPGVTQAAMTTPIADYQMDETLWNGTSGEVTNSSTAGSKYPDGVAKGGASVSAGKICNAGSFNGGGKGQYVQIDKSVSLTNFTYTVWVNNSEKKKWRTILDVDDDKQFLGIGDGKYQIWGRCRNNISITPSGGSAGWQHLAWTVNGDKYVVYVNGVAARSGKKCKKMVTGNHLMIGSGFNDSEKEYWKGMIDEVKLWNSALTAAQVKEIYDNENAGKNWDGTARTCNGASSTPEIPTVNSQSTIDTTPTITGTFESDNAVGGFVVTVDAVNYSLSGADLSNAGDNWSLTIPSGNVLTVGTYSVTAIATNSDGISSTDTSSNELVIVPPPPAIPTVNTQSTTDTTPTISGTFESGNAGGGFIVTVDTVDYPLSGSNLSNFGDNWSLTIPSGNALSVGTYSVTAVATNSSGTSSTDTTSNELTITSPSSTGCPLEFPSPLQTPVMLVKLIWAGIGQLGGDTDTILETTELKDKGQWTGKTCVTAFCTASNTLSQAITLPSFEKTSSNTKVNTGWSGTHILGSTTNEYKEIKTGGSSTITDNGAYTSYKIKTLKLGYNGTLNLIGGTDYWIERLTFDSNKQKIIVNGSGTARLYVNNDLVFKDRAQINSDGTPDNLFILAYKKMEVASDTKNVKFIAYTEGDVKIKSGVNITGAIASTKKIELKSSSAVVIYDITAVNKVEHNGLCGNETPTPALINYYAMDELTWDGTTNEVIDDTGNLNGTAKNGAITAQSSPALTGDPGTCGYGKFVRNNKSYIELPGYPDKTGSFTITAWIRSGTTGRIFVDDDKNTGGYALSLGDQGNTGMLRFFSRRVNPVSVDTLNAVIPSNTWTHVAAVHNVANKTRRIFVNGTAANLKTGGTSSTYTGTWGTDTGTASLGGETNSSNESNHSSMYFDGNIDEVKVYDSALNDAQIAAIMNERHSCSSSTIDHYSISHSGTGITCAPETITITAHNADHTVFPVTSDTTVAISTVPAVDAITASPVTIASGNSSATFTITESSVTADININVSDGSITETSGSANATDDPKLSFADSGFIFTVPDQSSCELSNNITIQAVKKSDTGTSCAPAFSGNNKPVSFTTSYISPVSGSKEIAVTPTGDSEETNPDSNPVDLDFNSNAEATFKLRYSDAGQIQLTADYDVDDLQLSGSDTFVVAPDSLHVFTDDTDFNCASGNGSCSKFRKSGESFNLKVKAACADGSITPGFNYTGVSGDNITYTPVSVAGTVGALSTPSATGNSISFVNGIFSILSSYSKVGVMKVKLGTSTVLDGSWLGVDLSLQESSTTDSGNIGRFTPDHFTIAENNQGSFSPACSGNFTYTGDIMGYDTSDKPAFNITAINGDGSTASNYISSFDKLSNGSGSLYSGAAVSITTPTEDNSQDGTSAGTKMVITASLNSGILQNSAGVLSYTFSGLDSFTYDKDSLSQISEFTSAIDLIMTNVSDADAITANNAPQTITPTGALIRYGRLAVNNAYGSENLPLNGIRVSSEYYDGSPFALNLADSCSSFDSTLINWSNPPAVYSGIASGSIDSTGSGVLSNGTGQFSIHKASNSALGPGSAGYADYYFPTDSWLQFDWFGSGNSDPKSRASFGVFNRSKRLIYTREVY